MSEIAILNNIHYFQDQLCCFILFIIVYMQYIVYMYNICYHTYNPNSFTMLCFRYTNGVRCYGAEQSQIMYCYNVVYHRKTLPTDSWTSTPTDIKKQNTF